MCRIDPEQARSQKEFFAWLFVASKQCAFRNTYLKQKAPGYVESSWGTLQNVLAALGLAAITTKWNSLGSLELRRPADQSDAEHVVHSLRSWLQLSEPQMTSVKQKFIIAKPNESFDREKFDSLLQRLVSDLCVDPFDIEAPQ